MGMIYLMSFINQNDEAVTSWVVATIGDETETIYSVEIPQLGELYLCQLISLPDEKGDLSL